MQLFAPPIERLVEQFEKLPGVGRKSAQRMAFHVLSMPGDTARDFANAILSAKESVAFCSVCQNLTDRDPCPVCAGEFRIKNTICVVSGPKDVAAIEKTREYKGLYHVLHGSLSPLAQVSPEDIRIRELIIRVAAGGIEEIILATDPDTEGEATAAYISQILRPFGVKITRLAYGIPVGGHLEFADEVTLTRALEGRREY